MEFDPSIFFGLRWGWLTVWVILFVALFLVTGFLGLVGAHPWSDVSASRVDWYHHEQCEAVIKTGLFGFFLQFHNFWSNLGYLAVGLLIAQVSNSVPTKTVGCIFVFLAICSAWFHGTLTEAGQALDMVGVCCALTVLIAYVAVEFWEIGYDTVATLLIFGGALVLGAVLGLFRNGGVLGSNFLTSELIVGVLVVILVSSMIVLIFRPGANQPTLSWAFWGPFVGFWVIGLLAVVFRQSDGDDNALLATHNGNYSQCAYSPGGLIQGHAIWHLLSAIMFLCFFECIRAKGNRTRSVLPWLIDNGGGT